MAAKKKPPRKSAKKTGKPKTIATHTHQGATRKNIPSAEMQPVVGDEVKTPILPDETAILSGLDAGTAALKAKLGKARQVKQAMMQELLTGKTRLA